MYVGMCIHAYEHDTNTCTILFIKNMGMCVRKKGGRTPSKWLEQSIAPAADDPRFR